MTPSKASFPRLPDDGPALVDGHQGAATRLWQTRRVEEVWSMPETWQGRVDDFHRVWALVMTPTRARIVRGLDETVPGPAELVLRTTAPRLRVLMAGEPGDGLRALAEDERAFVEQVGLLLDAHRRAGEFDGLILCATPEVLEALRHGLPGALRRRVVAEVPRDLMRLSEAELPHAVVEALEERHRAG